jgi:hypothetical protein
VAVDASPPVATGNGRDRAAAAAIKGPDSEIHTDRDECSSDESNGPDSPTGLKAVGSVYDFRLDGADSPPSSSSCVSNPFAAVVGPDAADLTKVARKQLRMIREVDVAVCHLNHTNTIISKILSSKYLRRWENHQIRLQDDCITSNTVSANDRRLLTPSPRIRPGADPLIFPIGRNGLPRIRMPRSRLRSDRVLSHCNSAHWRSGA